MDMLQAVARGTYFGRREEPRADADGTSVSTGAGLRPHLVAGAVGVCVGLLYLASPLLGLGATVGIAFCAVALSRPMVLCYLMVTAVALTGGVERGRLLPVLRPNEVGLLLSAALAVGALIMKRRREVQVPGHVVAAVAALITGTVLIPGLSYLQRGTELTAEATLGLLAPLQYVLLFWLFAAVPGRESDRRRLIHVMLLCGTVVAAVGLMQAAGVTSVAGLLNEWYGSSHTARAIEAARVTSLMAAWNGLGVFCMANIVVAWAVLPWTCKPFGRLNAIIAVCLSAACLLASGSFAGALGAIMGVATIEVLAERGQRAVPLLLAAGTAAVGIAVLWSLLEPLLVRRLNYQFGSGAMVPRTLDFRFQVWREVFWPAIRENPVWGVEPMIPENSAWHAFESEYILLLFRSGVVGLVGHLAWVAVTLAWLKQKLRRSAGLTRAVVTAGIALLVVLSVSGLTNAVFRFSGTADYLWMSLALVAGNEEVSA